ncbi:hypothetical protein [Microbispora sp. KK1-11]|uniref:hypothetical protein n=1 Tax=Microbispora sp. KK1-11 TaxID=2053005 RepID=UPI0011589694|nr:hypothetical protein [Microbispora sp. KK1-11]TQS21586.1 hypothetical protein FLW16_39125 [Microbispora sp. KK1-11]
MAIRHGLSALAALVMAIGCSAGGQAPEAARPSVSCGSAVSREALPTWARAGFSDDGSGVPHVFSEHGDIIAVLFEYPPKASADPDDANKILWVSRLPQQPMQPLTIEARLDGTTTSVSREISGGAGPSSVNLPRAGCWRLTLNWSGHSDAMTLTFT